MTLRVGDDVLNDAVNAAAANADGGDIQFYTGSRPANLGDAPGGTLLATVPLQNPAFGAGAGGEVVAEGVPITVSGAADGNIGWARVRDSGGTPIWDDDDVATSAAAITVNTLTVATGVDFTLTGYEFFVANPA